jgi:alkylation response protein AidB-like acyl-CoA dehydrogenase
MAASWHRVGYSRPKEVPRRGFPEYLRLQNKGRELAADFATRSATHDRDASHPIENYDRLREEGFLALTVGKERGGSGASFLDHTIAYEALGQGCPSIAQVHEIARERVCDYPDVRSC